MDARIAECQTLSELERTRPLTEEEQHLVFEKKLEIFQRIGQWRAENQKGEKRAMTNMKSYWF